MLQHIDLDKAKVLMREGWEITIKHHSYVSEYRLIMSRAGKAEYMVRLPYTQLALINKDISVLMAEHELLNSQIQDMLVQYLKLSP
jgi:hypothetical protein